MRPPTSAVTYPERIGDRAPIPPRSWLPRGRPSPLSVQLASSVRFVVEPRMAVRAALQVPTYSLAAAGISRCPDEFRKTVVENFYRSPQAEAGVVIWRWNLPVTANF